MSTQQKDLFPSYLPPIFRFLLELTTWAWFLLLAIQIDPLYILGLIISLLLLAVFNFPGDKNQKGPVEVPGIVRIGIEIFSAFLGIAGAFILFAEVGAGLQIILTLIAFVLDFQRWAWMLGIRSDPPISVTNIRKYIYLPKSG